MEEQFEKYVLDHLHINQTASLWWMSDFYEGCCKSLGLNFHNIYNNQSNIRRRLLKMKKKGLIDSCRVGSGFMGKSDFGNTSHNIYMPANFAEKYDYKTTKDLTDKEINDVLKNQSE